LEDTRTSKGPETLVYDMCGITSYCGDRKASEVIEVSLKRLDYRGYDSVGVAVSSESGLDVRKGIGGIDEIDEELGLGNMEGGVGIGHTRWATHGKVSEENAHPHISCDGRFAIVHNGIIENWDNLKEELDGCSFRSGTDSEVIAHYIERKARESGVEDAVREFMAEAEGSFAVVLLDSEKDMLFAFKKGSPLALGIGEEEVFVGSDAYAFCTYTDKAIFLCDHEYAVLKNGEYVLRDAEGRTLERKIKRINYDYTQDVDSRSDHYMYKEIMEIPEAIERLDGSLKLEQKHRLEEFQNKLKNKDRVVLTGSGTSYHAALLGIYFLQEVGVEAHATVASEFKNYGRIDENTVLVPISQSGETKDVLEAIDYCRKMGAEIASITNVPHSTVERKSDANIRIRAGQEICVAATKTFTNQLYLLMKLAEGLGGTKLGKNISDTIRRLLDSNEEKIKDLAVEIEGKKDIYIIGKGETYPVAMEIALKLKEISYIHAEGMMGGELKHGTLALVEEGTPVISLIPNGSSEIVSNVREVEARKGNTIKISPSCGRFNIPETGTKGFVFLSTVLGFLLTYWIASNKGLPIDKPRNLAKCVTTK